MNSEQLTKANTAVIKAIEYANVFKKYDEDNSTCYQPSVHVAYKRGYIQALIDNNILPKDFKNDDE